jgi:hypothetical protein
MSWSPADLALAEEHVSGAIRIVARQKELIEKLRRDGHATDRAESLLRTMEHTLTLFERDRDMIKRALESEPG